MVPESTMMYIEDVNRLVGVAVKEVIVRSICQRRAAVAPETDASRMNENTHADIMSEVVAEPYNPGPFGSADTAQAA